MQVGYVGRNRDSTAISGFTACLLALQHARCYQYEIRDVAEPLSRKLWHLSLVVSGGIDSGKRRNDYDKKPRRYAKYNRTAHLTARSDKSVARVTNKKDYTWRFVLLKLTTDRHEESRGLFATDSRATCSSHMALFDRLQPSSIVTMAVSFTVFEMKRLSP